MNIDQEAAVLRTAGAIKSLLDDGELHPWRDCIELARDFAGGRWRMAPDLAWAAMSEYVGAVRQVVWTGEKGSRLVGFVPDDVVGLVTCPKCGAPTGVKCRKLNAKGESKDRPHEAREVAAVQAGVPGLSAETRLGMKVRTFGLS